MKVKGQTFQPGELGHTHAQTYGLSRLVTHPDVRSLCATRNGMRAPIAPSIFHTYEKYLWTYNLTIIVTVWPFKL